MILKKTACPALYVKFQNVNSVTTFVQSDQGEEETIRILYVTFIALYCTVLFRQLLWESFDIRPPLTHTPCRMSHFSTSASIAPYSYP